MSLLLKPACLGTGLVLLLCTLLVTPAFAIETDRSTSIDRYRQALKVDPDNPTLHYILGLAQLKNGYADAAIESFRIAYPAYTDSIEMHYNMGLAFSRSGDADSALLYLEQAEALGALEMSELFPLVNAYYNVGLIYLEQEALNEANLLFKRVLVLDPDRVEIYRLLGDVAARSGNIEEAITLFSTYLEHYPDDRSAREYLYALHYNRALKQMESGDNLSAQASFEAAQAIAPESPIVSYYLGSIAYNSGDAESTILHLTPVYSTIPDELQESTRSMLYNSVLRSLDAQKLDQAIAGIMPLIQAPNARSKDLMLSGTVYLRRQEFIAAMETFNHVLKINPTNTQATINLAVAEEKAVEELFQKGLAAYKNEHFRDALDRFDEVLQIQPGERRSTGYRKKAVELIATEATGRFKDGRKALAAKDYLQAAILANAGLALTPDNAGGLRLRHEALQALDKDVKNLLENGFALLQRSDFAAAEAQFNKILQIDPENTKAQKGLAKSKQHRHTAALAEISKGNTALDEGKLEAAGKHFALAEKFAKNLPESVEGRARLGALISSLVAQELQRGRRARSAGDLKQAEAHFNNALKLTDTPEIRRELKSITSDRNAHAEGLLAAARTARNKKDFKTARTIYNRILTANPQHPAASELIALNAEIATATASRLDSARKKSAQGQHQDALTLYRQALDLEPTNKEALQGLQDGRKQIKTEISGYLQSGRAAFAQGDLKDAAVAFNKVLLLDPYQAEAKTAINKITSLEQTGIRPGDENRLYLQGIELYTQGKYSEAIQAWEKVLQLDSDHNKARMNIEKAKRKQQSIREFQSG